MARYLKWYNYNALFDVMLLWRVIWSDTTITRYFRWYHYNAVFEVMLL
jgi:hypothetical protein